MGQLRRARWLVGGVTGNIVGKVVRFRNLQLDLVHSSSDSGCAGTPQACAKKILNIVSSCPSDVHDYSNKYNIIQDPAGSYHNKSYGK